MYLCCSADQTITVEGVSSGEWKNNAFVEYIVQEPTIRIKGPVLIADLGKNAITSLDVSKCPSLYYLHLNSCKLSTLDLTHNPNLADLGCQGNNLTELDLSANTKLTKLFCFNNKL